MKATPLSKPPNDSITRVSALNAAAVHQLYRKTFNSEPPGGSVECARRKLAWHLQASREGGLPESARQHALAIAASSPARARIVSNAARRRQGLAMPNATATQLVSDHDPRIPMPGSVITKQHRDRLLIVRVLDDGFEFDRRRFSSLSAIATEVAGSRWNGFTFFGLGKAEANAR